MSTVIDSKAQAFEIEPVQTELRKISFSAIQVDSDSNAYRDPEDFTDEAVKPLGEDIARNGVCTPLLVQELPGDVYLLHNGHRRYTAITSNIRQGIIGFSP